MSRLLNNIVVALVLLAMYAVILLAMGGFGAPRYTESCPPEWPKEECPS